MLLFSLFENRDDNRYIIIYTVIKLIDILIYIDLFKFKKKTLEFLGEKRIPTFLIFKVLTGKLNVSLFSVFYALIIDYV